MSLTDVVVQDLLFLWVLLEIFFEGTIADELLLEFENFLLLHSPVGQMVEHALDS